MNPFHPKLRKALLADPLHQERGLTANRLLEYEGLLVELFDASYYPPRVRLFEAYHKTILGQAEKSPYRISEKTIAALKKEKLDPLVLFRLARIRNRTYENEAEFTKAVRIALDGRERQDIVAEIKEFQKKFMPNFKEIYNGFINRQAEAVQERLIDLRPGKLLTGSLALIWAWIRAVILRKDRFYAKGR